MNDRDRAALAAHNARVRALAGRMPSRRLHNAVCAIGYRAAWDTGVTAGWTVRELAKRSQRYKYAITARTLERAIGELCDISVLSVKHTHRYSGAVGQVVRGPSQYTLYYEWLYDPWDCPPDV